MCRAQLLSRARPLRPHGLQPARPLCPWDSSGKNTGAGCHFLLQGIFRTQGSNPCLLHLLRWQVNYLALWKENSERQSGLWGRNEEQCFCECSLRCLRGFQENTSGNLLKMSPELMRKRARAGDMKLTFSPERWY